MLVAILLVLVLGGGGAWFAINHQIESNKAERAEEVSAALAKKEREDRAKAEADAKREAQAEAKSAADAVDAAAAAERSKARVERQAREALDDLILNEGGDWTILESGNLYWRYADDSDELRCGNYDCTGVILYTNEGCPGGVYVEAAVESNGVVAGMANASLGAISPEGTGAFFLEDFTENGDTFRVSDVNCY